MALAANVLIGIAKVIVGLLGGSAAMLAEGAHSFADTLNEVFLLASIKQSERPADTDHPFGYGMNRFFWSLLAAVGIFVTGSLFSLYEGVHGLLVPDPESGRLWLSLGVLGLGVLLEGTSWLKALLQLRGEAAAEHRTIRKHLQRSTDPSVKTVFSEDSAALLGLFIAAGGVLGHHVTGDSRWDAVSALVIGVLLAAVAFLLGRDTKSLLIGSAADPELRDDLFRELIAYDGVDAVVEILTMNLGPSEVLLAARLDLADELNAAGVEDLSEQIAREIGARHPVVTQVFLDATRASRSEQLRSERIASELSPEPAD